MLSQDFIIHPYNNMEDQVHSNANRAILAFIHCKHNLLVVAYSIFFSWYNLKLTKNVSQIIFIAEKSALTFIIM